MSFASSSPPLVNGAPAPPVVNGEAVTPPRKTVSSVTATLDSTVIEVPVCDVAKGPKGSFARFKIVTRSSAGMRFEVWVRWSGLKIVLDALEKEPDLEKSVAIANAKKKWHEVWRPMGTFEPAFLEERRVALQEM